MALYGPAESGIDQEPGRKLKQAREAAGYKTARTAFTPRVSRTTAIFDLLIRMCELLDIEANDLLPVGVKKDRRSSRGRLFKPLEGVT
jgi:hypothetical protein